MNEKYDLVKVVKCDDKNFIDAIGIIKEIHYDKFYEILFVGRKLNDLSLKYGRILFTDDDIEGV